MATTINPTQLQQLQDSLTTARQSPTTANIAATWQLLSSWGDTYASAAYQAIAQPTSFYGEVARNAGALAGANSVPHSIPSGWLTWQPMSPTSVLPQQAQETTHSRSQRRSKAATITRLLITGCRRTQRSILTWHRALRR